MNLLARLMSHGFAISLVVLLAIGFIYRGEHSLSGNYRHSWSLIQIKTRVVLC